MCADHAPLLSVRDLDVSYGSIQVLHGLSFDVRRGEIVTLIGANGAGKSTTLRTISGLIRPRRGTVTLAAIDLTSSRPEAIVRLGVSHAPEGRRIFPGLTVRENLELGASVRRAWRADFEVDLERVFGLFPRLRERHRQLGWSLSGGEQQMLTIGRALIGRPQLLLLDEPSLGLAPKVTDELFTAIEAINDGGVTVLLVEQNAFLALEVADRGYVLENGRVSQGAAASVLAESDSVRAAYFGGRSQ